MVVKITPEFSGKKREVAIIRPYGVKPLRPFTLSLLTVAVHVSTVCSRLDPYRLPSQSQRTVVASRVPVGEWHQQSLKERYVHRDV